ncbi:MAG: hypothetical protein HFF08_03085 [Oscillospiraceae bacterium]|nr:hypothetical protein [Oscillospiraceae bacterium]
MSSVTTFGAFNMARLGIYVSSRAIDVTGNNIANINTVGYTRQKANASSLYLGGSDRYVSMMDQRIGQGAIISKVSQLRDPYLDIRYRNETTNVQSADTKLGYLDRLSAILDEVAMGSDDEGVLEARFSDLISQMNKLAGTDGAGKDLNDTLVRQSAEALCKLFNEKAKALEELRAEKEKDFYEKTIPAVNSLLTQIQDLTASIRKSQIHGGDALELKDRRNMLIDELSGYVKIEVTYDEEDVGDGLMVERLNIRQPETGAYLIKGVYASKFEKDDLAKPVEEGGYPMPIRLAPLVNLKGEVLRNEANECVVGSIPADAHGSADLIETLGDMKNFLEANLDSYKGLFQNQTYLNGELRNQKYILQAVPVKNHGEIANGTEMYGDNMVEFTGANLEIEGLEGVDIQVVTPDGGLAPGQCYDWVIYRYSPPMYPVQIPDDALSGSLQADREMLTEEGEYAMESNLEYDGQAGTKHGIPFYQKALDTLASTFAQIMNEANVIPDKDLYYVKKGADGEPLTGPDGGLIYTDAEGNVVDEKDRVMLEGYRDWYKGGALFSNDSNGDDTSNISAANISVAQSWKYGQTKIVHKKDPNPGSTDNDNLKHMLILLEEKHEFRSGTDRDGIDPYFKGTFQEMLSNHIAGILGSDTHTTELMLQNYMQLQDDLYVKRESVSGVDLNDEAANMMQFQKSYSAACRLMTTVDQMLDKLINGTAV